jgi:hypothetical protein
MYFRLSAMDIIGSWSSYCLNHDDFHAIFPDVHIWATSDSKLENTSEIS